jgi:Tol biopolymer transport system component
MIGKSLAHYEITSLLGKGGMGEVYQAKDLKLGRDVAIKVLPEEFAKDSDRVARFQREAKLLASLNHPNIAAIHGLEESGGTNFLVLELVEGETLADRLKRGPIPVEESLKLALQIAEALESAHEKGVIHRDLKPANIKVTPEGKVKVLDFGLAKAFAGDQDQMALSNSPTLSLAATQQGIILGTAAYMSPEQAKGKSIDRRTDIWAFGVVLFEMLTGRQLFAGETVSETLAAVLMREPDFAGLPGNLHPKIIEMLERCLEKDLRNRYGSINDARLDIQKVLAAPDGIFPRPAAAVPAMGKLLSRWVAAAVLLTAVLVGTAVWRLKPAPPTEPLPVIRLAYELPEGQQFGNLTECALAVSPNGRQIVYATQDGLYLRSIDELDARLIPGTEGNPEKPFFSPDGKWIGYWSGSESQLKKIGISGGAPFSLGDAGSLGFFIWRPDDTIIYGQQGKGIMRVSANGETPQAIISDAKESTIDPQILPDGKSVLYSNVITPPEKIMLCVLKSGERRELFPGDTARYLPTGHILYALGNNLLAVPFDLKTLKVTGGSVPVVENVLRAGGAPQYGISDSGTLVYLPSMGELAKRTLLWVDRNGKEEPLAAPPDLYWSPRISPDGTQIAMGKWHEPGSMDVYIWNLARKTMTRLTFDPAEDDNPVWTRDGKRIVFETFRKENPGVCLKSADGTGTDELLRPTNQVSFPGDWSPDGKSLLIQEVSLPDLQRFYIGAVSMEGDHKWKPLLQGKYRYDQPRISPDGRWLAYTSNESGQNEIYVRPYPDVDSGRWQISNNGGDSALWSPDGRELFYRNGEEVMAVPLTNKPAFSVESPKVLFQGSYVPANHINGSLELGPWEISPDGKRFLMMKAAGADATAGSKGPRKINIVVNWFEELKRRVPTK